MNLAVDFLKEGVVDYLVKPVEKEKLIDVVTKAAGQRTFFSSSAPKMSRAPDGDARTVTANAETATPHEATVCCPGGLAPRNNYGAEVGKSGDLTKKLYHGLPLSGA